jgi:hypothetical protein
VKEFTHHNLALLKGRSCRPFCVLAYTCKKIKTALYSFKVTKFITEDFI